MPCVILFSLSKSKESKNDKKAYDSSGYDVIPLNKQREKHNTDEGVFDFVDSPLSDKHLVPAGSGKTSHVNVKKGPNGQEYEYEYIYYYYEDEEPDSAKSGGNCSILYILNYLHFSSDWQPSQQPWATVNE